MTREEKKQLYQHLELKTFIDEIFSLLQTLAKHYGFEPNLEGITKIIEVLDLTPLTFTNIKRLYKLVEEIQREKEKEILGEEIIRPKIEKLIRFCQLKGYKIDYELFKRDPEVLYDALKNLGYDLPLTQKSYKSICNLIAYHEKKLEEEMKEKGFVTEID